jgi:hypothetical protein
MATVRVTCITKPYRSISHEHITHLGGPTWKWDRDQVIRSIELKQNVFYVVDPATDAIGYVALSDRATDGQADLEIAGNDACARSAKKRSLKFI